MVDAHSLLGNIGALEIKGSDVTAVYNNEGIIDRVDFSTRTDLSTMLAGLGLTSITESK